MGDIKYLTPGEVDKSHRAHRPYSSIAPGKTGAVAPARPMTDLEG